MPRVAAKRLCSILTGVLLAGASALAQTPQERGWCEGEDAVTVDQRIDGCSAVIKAARDKGDKLAEAFNNRGVGYRLKGDYDRAIADYNQAIKLNAKFAIAYNNRAWAYFKAGKAAQGLPDAERSLQMQPGSADALNTRGHILEALGRREEAIADFRGALSRDPSRRDSAEGLKRLGATP